MCDAPFIPIFPICFQCGTDQNPCRCKVVGPTIGMSTIYLLIVLVYVLICMYLYMIDWSIERVVLTKAGFFVTVIAAVCIHHGLENGWASVLIKVQVFCYPASLFCGCCMTKKGKEYVFLFFFVQQRWGETWLMNYSVLAYPVKLNGQVSNAIPIWWLYHGLGLKWRMDMGLLRYCYIISTDTVWLNVHKLKWFHYAYN